MSRASSYRISRDEGIVRIDFSGNPSSDELHRLVAHLEEMENSERRLYVMIDAEILLSTAEVREGADYAKSMNNQPERIAVVAPREISYGISRIFKVFRDSPVTELRVFRELDEARDWLLEKD